MKIAIMQPYFLPYIGYFQLISAVDKFVIYDDVNFIKKGWINRNNILVDGKSHLFSLPISNASQNKKIRELELAHYIFWQQKFISTLDFSYSKAPYYKEVKLLLIKIFDCNLMCVSEFIASSLKEICSYLDISTKIISSSTIYKNEQFKGQDRIIDICLQENVSTYVNASGGKKLYDETVFLDNNVELKFLNGDLTEYSQFKNDFVPRLSIIDVLMFNSKSKVKEFLQNYRLN